MVNLHWVTDGFLSVEEIGKITKPLVWSLYDMWPFCGTEHYGVDSPDARWQTGYSRENRPRDESGVDIDRWTWKRKRASWDPMTMVPASTWLETSVQDSALMGSWPVTRLPHVVDTDRFAPMDKHKARKRAGLPEDSPQILFLASAGIFDARKGFDLLEQCWAEVRASHPGARVVVAWPSEPDYVSPSGMPIIWHGSVAGDEELRSLYCSAEVLVVPSREDNMPLTAMEAQSCGVPVVAFDIGGLPDIVVDQETGLLVAPDNVLGLGSAITRVLDDRSLRERLSESAVAHARHTWSSGVVATRYRDLYGEVLS